MLTYRRSSNLDIISIFDSDPFGCLYIMDMLTQDTTVSIYVTWLHKVKDFDRNTIQVILLHK
jgi:hypothetical protein